MIDTQQAVGEIAAHLPETTAVFDELGIRYCCQGWETLESACQTAGLAPQDVIARLRRAVETDAAGRPSRVDPILETLIGKLIQARNVLLDEAPRIQELAYSVRSCPCGQQPNAAEIARLAETLLLELSTHLAEETHTLFPTIRQVELAYVGGGSVNTCADHVRLVVEQMVQGHEAIGHLLSKIHELTAGYTVTSDTCAPYSELCQRLQVLDHEIRQEIHLENHVLFDRALQLSGALCG